MKPQPPKPYRKQHRDHRKSNLQPKGPIRVLRHSLFLLRPGTIGINPALDLCDPLLMTEDHLRDLNDSPHENRRNRNQPNAKIEDRSHRTRPSTTRSGGADRDRTGGLLVANQALSQLSYSPKWFLVGLGRVELPTSPLSGVRSSHLSYRPGFPIVLPEPDRAGLSAFSC